MQINKIFVAVKNENFRNHSNVKNDKNISTYQSNPISFKASQGIVATVQGSLASLAKQKSLANIKMYGRELFTPLEVLKNRIMTRLMSVNIDAGDFPEELKSKLIEAVKNNKFNLNDVYKEFYSLLLLCTTLQEVDTTYPSIKYPRTTSTNGVDTNVQIITKGRKYKGSISPQQIKILSEGQRPRGININKHSNELPALKIFIKENAPQEFSEKEINDILIAYNQVGMDKLSFDEFKRLLFVKNPKNNKYITAGDISGLFNTMSRYLINANQKCKNILETYITLLQNNQTESACMLAKILTLGNKSKLAEKIISFKNDNELNAFLETIKSGDIYWDQINSCKNYSELYQLTNNINLINDFKKIFNISEINKFIKVFKANPEILQKGMAYESCINFDSNLVNESDIKALLDRLGLSEHEQFVELSNSFEQTEELKEYALDPRTFKNRFKDADFDKSIIGVLQQLYLEQTPLSHAIIHISENDSAKAAHLTRYNNEIWSVPNAELLKIIKSAKEIDNALSLLSESLQNLSDEELKSIALKNSTKNFWRDFHDYTRSRWMPVRLIKDKANNENTLYTIDNLINAYIFKLFKEYKNGGKTPEELGINPLEFANESLHLSKALKSIIDDSYLSVYISKTEKPYLFTSNKFMPTAIENVETRREFEKFYSNFDIEALKKSFEKVENLYKKRFYRIYTLSNDRYKILERDLQNELKIVIEKRDFGKKTDEKTAISEIDKKELISSIDETFEQVSESDLNNLKFIVSNIKNPTLKARCQVILNNDSIDVDYFNFINNILKSSIITISEKEVVLNEEKALVLFMLNDKYLSDCAENITEQEFIEKELQNYKLSNGEYDYKKFYDESKAELNFFSLVNKLEATNDEEFLNFVIQNVEESNYIEMSELIEEYSNLSAMAKSIIKSDLTSNDLNIKLDAVKEGINKYKDSIWDFEKPEIIILNEAGVNKKVIITPNAKKEIFEHHNSNITKYESEIKKFIKAADRYAPDERASGIKIVRKDGSAEIKIYGKSGTGGMRLYSRPIIENDTDVYRIDENDSLPIKFIFDKYDDHL